MNFKLIISFVFVIITLLSLFLWYYRDSQTKIHSLQESNSELEVALEINKQTLQTWNESYDKIQYEIENINQKFLNTRRENSLLKDKLEKHDIGYLGYNKPGLVEKIINSATAKTARCFELLSGSKLTVEEKGASNSKEFNSECADLYDNYIDN